MLYAELTINHRTLSQTEIATRAAETFGPNDLEVITRSAVCGERSEYWRELIIYATERPGFRLLCLSTSDQELQLVVEPLGIDTRRASVSAWEGFRRALDSASARVALAEVKDPSSGDIIMAASAGAVVEAKRSFVIEGLTVGLANVAVAILGITTFAREAIPELLAGTAPGLATMLVVIGLAIRDTRRQVLRWQD